MRRSTSEALPLAIAVAAAMAAAAVPAPADGVAVRVTGDAESGFRLLRDGEPFRIRGAAGAGHLDVLAACGGNAIRTWDAETATKVTDGESLLDRAGRLGVGVTVGLWLGHERHGFRYDDAAQVARQREEVEATVRRLKGHPAVLSWGLGNEMEGPTGQGDDARVWREVGHLAALVKSIDPDHPVMPVVANVNDAKVAAILRHAPAVDILGVNAYAGAAGVGDALRRMGWTKPYCVTEYGLPGPWETEQTAWKAPVEPTSRSKAATYHVTTVDILADESRCLGCYAFLWGSKQEATASWFGMFLPTGEKTITVDAIARAWTGRWPVDRAPVLGETDVPLAGRTVAPTEGVTAVARYRDPEGRPLEYRWEVRRESDDRREGGDAEREPERIDGCVVESDASGRVVLRAPRAAGNYRLFVTVRDGAGSGCMDNWAFRVAGDAPRDAGAAKPEPTNDAERAAARQAADAAVDAKYAALVASLPAAEQEWERTLERNLGSFYLPLHKRDRLAGRSTAWDFVADDPALPRVLLIGDSVSRGYTQAVRRALAGRANVHRAPANCGPTASGVKNLAAWLGDGDWDVIHFNFGIHDRSTPVADYTARLEAILERLMATNATLVWASSTPIPDKREAGQTAASIVERNAAAAAVMARHGVAIDDLFTFIMPRIGEVQPPGDVHFTAAGYDLLGGEVARSILAVLESRARR